MKNTGFSEITRERLYYEGSEPWYIEIALTGKCNFTCKYCNRFTAETQFDDFYRYIKTFKKCNHIQLTGGEPTLHKEFIRFANLSKQISNVVGLSTNGTYGIDNYLSTNIDMFSISLDDYDTEILKQRGYKNPDQIIETIKELTKHKYVNVGVVVDHINYQRIEKIIDFILSLGVDDIKLSTNTKDEMLPLFNQSYPEYPILNYRVENFKEGEQMRGNPPKKCYLVKNDITIVGNYHYPCLVYFREGGKPISKISSNLLEERGVWFNNHDSQQDPICNKYCMDFKCEFNIEKEKMEEI